MNSATSTVMAVFGVLWIAANVFLLTHWTPSRDQKQLRIFRATNPCPATGKTGINACPGWVVEYIKPLRAGGADHPSNMQWHTKADARVKAEADGRPCAKPETRDQVPKWFRRLFEQKKLPRDGDRAHGEHYRDCS